MQGPRAGIDACAMGWAPRVCVAMKLLVKRSLCFALDSNECIFLFSEKPSKLRALMADPVQPPIDTPEGGDAHNNGEGGNAHNYGEGGNARNNGAGGGDGGVSGGSKPLPPPHNPADPHSEAHLKSIAEHVARFLAARTPVGAHCPLVSASI